MTAEAIKLEAFRDRYPLRLDWPVKRVIMRFNDIDYAIAMISPAEMDAARAMRPWHQQPLGFPAFASLMERQEIDIHPKPANEGPELIVMYDDEAYWRREEERRRWVWETEYRRTNPA